MHKPSSPTNLVILSLLWLVADLCKGIDKNASDLHISPLKNSYFAIEMIKNDPIIHTQDEFAGRHVTPYYGYRNVLNNSWMMGLGLNYKSFTKPNGKELAFMSIQHEAYIIYPIHYPIYLMFGPKLLYLLPTQRSFLPILGDGEFSTEIGAGISIMLAYKGTSNTFISVRIDRWRGTKTDKFHGTEVGLGLNYKL